MGFLEVTWVSTGLWTPDIPDPCFVSCPAQEGLCHEQGDGKMGLAQTYQRIHNCLVLGEVLNYFLFSTGIKILNFRLETSINFEWIRSELPSNLPWQAQDTGLGLKMPETIEPPGMVPLAKAAWDGELTTCRAPGFFYGGKLGISP